MFGTVFVFVPLRTALPPPPPPYLSLSPPLPPPPLSLSVPPLCLLAFMANPQLPAPTNDLNKEVTKKTWHWTLVLLHLNRLVFVDRAHHHKTQPGALNW